MAKKLLYVLNHMDWFFSHRLPVAQEAKSRGWDIYVAADNAENDTRLKELGFKGINLPSQDGRFNPFREIGILFSIYNVIRKLKPDVTHAITIKYVLYAGLAARFISKAKIVFTIAGLGYLFSGKGLKVKLMQLIAFPLLRFALGNKYGRLIVQNPDDERVLLHKRLVKPNKVTVIKGSGVKLDQFEYTPEQPTDTPHILMATRLLGEKGVIEYCKAARQLISNNINAVFQLAGTFDTKNPDTLSQSDLQPYIDDGSIEFLGHENDMVNRMKNASIVALPSYYREGVPKVLLEACSLGRAIVTTDHVGCREAVDDGVNGLYCKIKDVDSLAISLKTLITDSEKRLSFGKAGRKKAEEEFSATEIAKKTCDLYEF